MMVAPDLSLVIPAHNAARFLKSTIDLIQKELDPTGMSYEILIMENGSSDGTSYIAEELARTKKQVRCHLDPDAPGKGRALTNGISLSRGKWISFCDADLEIPPTYIPQLVGALREGYDISVSSKRHPDSKVRCPYRRTFLSRGYNRLVRVLFRTGIYSHQDGFKAFKREAILKILPFVQDTGWFWDTEVLVIAHWMGYRVKEVPIVCDYGWESTFDTVSGVNYFFKKLFSLLVRSPTLKRKVRKIGS